MGLTYLGRSKKDSVVGVKWVRMVGNEIVYGFVGYSKYFGIYFEDYVKS